MPNPNAGKHSGAWKPGQSGNPGGRPAIAKVVRKLAQDHSEASMMALVELRDSAGDERVRLEAAKAILAYGIGKPVQPVHKVVEHVKRSPREMSLEELDRREAAIMAELRGETGSGDAH